jgi:enoyl-CoA hydratase/carnithine racemase
MWARVRAAMKAGASMNDRVRLTFDGTTAYVALQRAEKHNGVDFAMLREVLAAQTALRRRRDLRAVILHGLGPSFCAGLDFKSVLAKPAEAARMTAQLWSPRRNDFQVWSLGWRDLGVLVVAVVHGSCFGAGLQLALGADVRIAAPDARFSVMEAKWGLVPDMGGPTLLRELLPLDVAKELTMTGRILDAAAARAAGLVTHVSEDPLAHASRLAAEVAAHSPDAVAAGKLLLQEAWGATERASLAAERRWQRRVVGGKNQRTAIRNNQKRESAPFAPRRLG